MRIFLHMDDLRVHDNAGLSEAGSGDEVLPVHVRDPRIVERQGEKKRKFREGALERLRQEYHERDGSLLLRDGRTADMVEHVAQAFDAEAVYYNRSYSPLKMEIERELEELELESRSFKDRLLVEPRELETEYSTFSQFYSDWKQVGKRAPFHGPEQVADVEEENQAEGLEADELPEPGEEAALERWESFRDERLERYKYDRDDVSDPEAVSRLSPYYSSGLLGLRTVLSDIEEMIRREDDSGKIRNYAKYRSELAWREFFYQVLYHNPESVTENYKDFENGIDWRNDPEELEAWKEGRTGVPFVDAGIRELLETGYMHNRLRQNVASFLTKHLMIDWREGASFFRKHLVDHDTASNTGGWQWSASTGTDSVPVRIFNPVKQGRKYDENSDYIRRWIPELRDLDPEEIHRWVEMGEEERSRLETDYPSPIVDFDARYHEGKKMFERALGKR
ncbi:MAG: deoxyribodipyrimidine photo-lyase [Candidatus Nanohaloarchaea archaeon]